MDNEKLGFDTKLVHAGDLDDAYGSAITPIYQTSTFRFTNANHGAEIFSGKTAGFVYSRIANPTVDALEKKLSELENANSCVAFASGMAAVSTIFTTLLSAGDHVVCSKSVYGPSRILLETTYAKFGVETTFVDTSDLLAIEQALRMNTKILHLESPANPTMDLTDIRRASAIAHKTGTLVCVDNTFCSPLLQRPLDLGADIVLHSLTKSINGHSDVIGGALMIKDIDLGKKLRKGMVLLGGNMDANQAFLVSRGVKTLSLRVERAQENAQKVAEFLETHPNVAWVNYPGLPSFKQYELAKTQMCGAGSMIAFGVKGGLTAGKTVMNNVKLAMLAVSLGGIETLIQHPASMTHAGLSQGARESAGIRDDLIRYAIGIESVEDIIADIDQALNSI